MVLCISPKIATLCFIYPICFVKWFYSSLFRWPHSTCCCSDQVAQCANSFCFTTRLPLHLHFTSFFKSSYASTFLVLFFSPSIFQFICLCIFSLLPLLHYISTQTQNKFSKKKRQDMKQAKSLYLRFLRTHLFFFIVFFLFCFTFSHCSLLWLIQYDFQSASSLLRVGVWLSASCSSMIFSHSETHYCTSQTIKYPSPFSDGNYLILISRKREKYEMESNKNGRGR